jgi:serine/threonine protein kinase
MKNEAELLLGLDHPNIVRLYELLPSLTLVLEYVDGSTLNDFVKDQGKMPDPKAMRLFVQIASALEYLHKHGIAHRDLHAGNILLTAGFQVKLLDFGFALRYKQGDRFRGLFGCLHYQSPEAVADRCLHPEPNDVWQCGITLYFMLTGGCVPFYGTNQAEVKWQIRCREVEFLNFHGSFDSRGLVHRMTRKYPERRPNFNMVKQDAERIFATTVGLPAPKENPRTEDNVDRWVRGDSLPFRELEPEESTFGFFTKAKNAVKVVASGVKVAVQKIAAAFSWIGAQLPALPFSFM